MMKDSLSRRSFLKATAAGVAGTVLARDAWSQRPETLDLVESLPLSVTRPWIGRAYWANRWQDWRLHAGRIECLTTDTLRTVAILTREITDAGAPSQLNVRASLLQEGEGFGGFLIGAGGGALDYRAAALVQQSSGEGGGLLCVCDANGRAHFREHTDETRPFAFNELPSQSSGAGATLKTGDEILLQLQIVPQTGALCELRLSVSDASGKVLSQATRRDVVQSEVRGGFALVSTPNGRANTGAQNEPRARWAFREVRCGGAGITNHPDRALGPIAGALYSLNTERGPQAAVLKLSAQLMPIGESEAQNVRFQFRAPGETGWRNGATAQLGDGFNALFRIENWDARRDWEYQVLWGTGAAYAGVIRRDTGTSRPLVIGLLGCIVHTGRTLDGGNYTPDVPSEKFVGRYTPQNLYFPHRELAQNVARHEPDLLVFSGDQIYEGNPTRQDQSDNPLLDYLYKWVLWMWSFRDLTRSVPTIVQTDDHDVYHGNLWGAGGLPSPHQGGGDKPGYKKAPQWVNMVQRTQCGHNPDAYDPTPVAQNISVYYGAFAWGGVSFAVLEDRKWKSPPLRQSRLESEAQRELLGARQEKFLADWKTMHRSLPKIALTQTAWATLNTTSDGRPRADDDSNGSPKAARDRAIALMRDAGALLLSGDQHLPTLVRHGLQTHSDAIVQFTVPAGSNFWLRWFEPKDTLPNATAMPFTGDWTDPYGNHLRVLAVANPKVTQAVFRRHHKANNSVIADRSFKNDGYGLVRVHHAAREFIIECWPYDANSQTLGAQFPGWPQRLSFAEATRANV